MPRRTAIARRSGRTIVRSSTYISARTSPTTWQRSSGRSRARSPRRIDMQLGFIGLGRMGANMVRRLVRDGHEVVAYNRTVEKAHELADEEKAGGNAISAADTVEALVATLTKPRIAWIMV